LNIYLMHSISGLSYDEIMKYYNTTIKELKKMGYNVLNPMLGKENLRYELELKAEGYKSPIATNHAIVERDRWMLVRADVAYCDFTGIDKISIGCCMELAWAHDRGKHMIIVMEKDNVHNHCFVREAADIIFDNTKEAKIYLRKLIKGE
jgi:nucleoside 2-deoxyribosyltransferase